MVFLRILCAISCWVARFWVCLADSPPFHTSLLERCEVKHIVQRLDHNGSFDGQFEQRYIICPEQWVAGGPLLFFTGSEANIMVYFNNSGFIFEMAAQLRGMVVFAEHRYYGQSRPLNFTEKSLESMKWLTVDNALADFKTLIESLKANISGLENASVVTMGGSYGGLLSAWMRMKYPGTVTAALASSAPLRFVGGRMPEPSSSMYRVATEVYRAVAPACAYAIHRSWGVLDNMTRTDAGANWLKELFGTCKDVDYHALASVKLWLTAAWLHMAVSNYPYPTALFTPLPTSPVKTACSHLTAVVSNTSDQDLLVAIAKAASVYYNHTGQLSSCLNPVWSGDFNPNWGFVQWQYQNCRELSMAAFSDGVTDMFYTRDVNTTENIENCEEWTGVPFNHDLARQFGGDDLRGFSNIIFSNGKLDPWSPGGISLAQQSENISVILIDDAAHHLDLEASHPDDPPSVTDARREEIKIIQSWIRPKPSNAT